MKDTGLHKSTTFWLDTTLNSYSQLFFSQHKPFAVLILIASLLSAKLGLAGLAAVVLINILAFINALDPDKIRAGVYGYNALLLGMALLNEFKMGLAFGLLFVFSILFLLLVSTLLQGFLDKYKLPYLSIPFLITWSIIQLAAGSFANLELSQDHLFVYNQSLLNQWWWTDLGYSLEGLVQNELLKTYLLTLGSIVFQHSVLAGLLIAIGLLIFSRIFFTLSALGFGFAYFFYVYFGADIQGLTYFLGGSNFIFMALAVGGYYVVPNAYSYLSVMLLIPATAFLHISLGKVFHVFQLQTFTLAFSIVVICFLFFLYQRQKKTFLRVVYYHYESAESQVYHYLVQSSTARLQQFLPIMLPFYGSWKVSQGYEGKITHLGKWNKALDFVIESESGKTYQDPGVDVTDYYCFNKPVLAPYDGYVYDIVNTVDDNAVGEVNTQHNWGNTIILNHLNGVYSQLSHLKRDSISVQIGEYVTAGTHLANCGSSGRSPEPHLHFQLQNSPEVGAQTMEYPLRYFIQHVVDKKELKISEVPEEGSVISSIEHDSALQSAFDFLPGQKLRWMDENSDHVIEWEVFTNAWNQKYFQCKNSGAIAYFQYDGTMFYFTDFTGSRSSLLFQFYLASYRIFLSSDKAIASVDYVPLSVLLEGPQRWLQDFISPFFLFMKAEHRSSLLDNSRDGIWINSSVRIIKGFRVRSKKFKMHVKSGKICELVLAHKKYSVCGTY